MGAPATPVRWPASEASLLLATLAWRFLKKVARSYSDVAIAFKVHEGAFQVVKQRLGFGAREVSRQGKEKDATREASAQLNQVALWKELGLEAFIWGRRIRQAQASQLRACGVFCPGVAIHTTMETGEFRKRLPVCADGRSGENVIEMQCDKPVICQPEIEANGVQARKVLGTKRDKIALHTSVGVPSEDEAKESALCRCSRRGRRRRRGCGRSRGRVGLWGGCGLCVWTLAGNFAACA